MQGKIVQLPMRKIGMLETSALGYGCMGLSECYGKPLEKEQAITVIRDAYKHGVTYFDTADIYGYGENEKIVGEAIRPFRNKITIATKCGIVYNKDRPAVRGVSNAPDYIWQACNQSLQRLGVDCIDLFYLHRIDPNTSIEVSIEALAKLVEQRKIRHIGLSEADPETIKRANLVYPITAVQVEYSLWTRSIENNNVKQTCEELGIGVVSYSPLGKGFLTGTIKDPNQLESTDFRRNLPRFAEENIKANFKLVNFLEQIAEQKCCTAAQLTLAWLLKKGDFIVPIPGTKKLIHLIENINSLDIKLTDQEVEYLDCISKKYAPQQPRYTAAAMQAYKLME